MYKIERERDAQAIARALGVLYPSYIHTAVRPKGCWRYRIAVSCRATGAFLTYAKQ